MEICWVKPAARARCGGRRESPGSPARFGFCGSRLPIVRLARVGLILLRLSDRLVRRMGKAAQSQHRVVRAAARPETRIERPPSIDRAAQRARTCAIDRPGAARPRAGRPALRASAGRSRKPRREPSRPHSRDDSPETPSREIPVEAVVERLIQMTPERLARSDGAGSVKALDRYLRLLDLPLVRRLPVVRNLVAYREKSPAEAVALAANYLGQLIQRGARRRLLLRRSSRHAVAPGLSGPPGRHDRQRHAHASQAIALAGLGVSLSFLDRELAFAFSRRFARVVDKVQTLMGWPVIILGVVCLVFWLLGRLVPQDRQSIGRLLRARGRGPVRHPHQRR